MSGCGQFEISFLRTVIEPFFIPLTLAAIIPQCLAIKGSGTRDLSPAWMINFFLFSTSQLSSQLLNAGVIETVQCIRDGHLRGFRIFGALLGDWQVLAQWTSALILLLFYIYFYVEANEEEMRSILPPTPAASSPAHQAIAEAPDLTTLQRFTKASVISRYRIQKITSSFTVVFLIPSLILSIRAHEAQFDNELVRDGFHAFYKMSAIILGVVSLLFASLQQTRDILLSQKHTRGGFSPSYLRSQCLVVGILGLLEFFRRGNYFPDTWSPHPRWRAFGITLTVSILYFAHAVTFAVNFTLRKILAGQCVAQEAQA